MKNDENKLQKVMAALQADDSFLDCVLEMVDTVENEQDQLKSGDDAEEAVVSVIQKTGTILLEKWANKTSIQMEYLAREDKQIRPHEKKISAGIPLLET